MSGDRTYFVRFRGTVKGPFDLATLRTLVARRQLTRAHSISTDGITWRTASEVTELFPAADRTSVRERLQETARTRRSIQQESEAAPPPVEADPAPARDALPSAGVGPATGFAATDASGALHICGLEGRDEIDPLLARLAIGAAAVLLLFLLLPFGVHEGRLQSIVGMARSDDPSDALLLGLVLAAGGTAFATALGRARLTRGVTWIVSGVVAAVSLSSYPGLPVIGPLVLAQIWFWPALIAGSTIWRWREPDARVPRVLLIGGGSVLAAWAVLLLSLVIGTDELDSAMQSSVGDSGWLPLTAAVGLLLGIGSPAAVGTLGIVTGSTGVRRGPIRPTLIVCGLSAALLAAFIVVDAAVSLAGSGSSFVLTRADRIAAELAALDVLHATLWTARFAAVLLASATLITVGFAQLALTRAERRVLESTPDTGPNAVLHERPR